LSIRFFMACVLPLLGGCHLTSQSRPARAHEAALDLNLNARFGRMQLVTGRVAPSMRKTFFETRKGWGSEVRVADYDMAALTMKGSDEAESIVKVTWYHVSESDVHTTTLKQSWRDVQGTWQLVAEERSEGDVGLLGEKRSESNQPSAPQSKNVHFPTIYLGNKQPAATGDSTPSVGSPTGASEAAATP